MSAADSPAILQPGRNCWRLARCRRAAFLVDGEAYFSAFAEVVARARQSVLILGWDVDSGIRLWRDGRQSDLPAALGPFLNAVTSRRKGLHVHVLDWDFAMLFAFEREPLPVFQLGWRTHPRLRFALDGRHPAGASHHQKVVVVDDRIAFVGGFDLARGRWDTPEHRPRDDRRIDHGTACPPFHDVQLMVEGEVAAVLGDLARERWRRATGEELTPPEDAAGSLWPEGRAADLERVDVAVSRTAPQWEDHPRVEEVRHLYTDAIAAARSCIYLESQYLTAVAVGEALAARLREKAGPEVVAVLPRECGGWLEETTMGVRRARLLRRLREADRYGRLKVLCPRVEGGAIQVHAKVLVVDDRLVRVGSSNLSNRSMGLDTECDLTVEADGEETRRAVRRFRDRLLAEHLGTEPQRVASAIAARGSLGAAVEELAGGPRTLVPLSGEVEEWLEALVPETSLLDPERPVRFEQLVAEMVPEEEEEEKGGRSRRLGLAVLLVAALALAAAWRWTALGSLLDLQTLRGWGEALRQGTGGPLFFVAVFVVASLALVPVTLLILATALVFDPAAGFACALAGCLLSALAAYGLGRRLGRETVRRLAGKRLNRLSRWLGRRGLAAVTAVRFLPIAPFTVVNLVAGASHIGGRDFLLGTALGMAPGILAIMLFESSLEQVIERPEPESFLLLAAVLAAVGASVWGLRRWLGGKKGGVVPAEGAEDE